MLIRDKEVTENDFLPVNMRCSLLVYSNPHASFSLEIMLASLSSEADTPCISLLESLVV